MTILIPSNREPTRYRHTKLENSRIHAGGSAFGCDIARILQYHISHESAYDTANPGQGNG